MYNEEFDTDRSGCGSVLSEPELVSSGSCERTFVLLRLLATRDVIDRDGALKPCWSCLALFYRLCLCSLWQCSEHWLESYVLTPGAAALYHGDQKASSTAVVTDRAVFYSTKDALLVKSRMALVLIDMQRNVTVINSKAT